MNKLGPGDQFVVPSTGATGRIVKIGWNSIRGEDEYIVTWDHQPGAGECSYLCDEVDPEWEKRPASGLFGTNPKPKVLTGSKAVVKINGKVVGTFKDVSFNVNYPKGQIEEITPTDRSGSFECTMTRGPCDHQWVDIGFTHSKIVCKKCDKEKV